MIRQYCFYFLFALQLTCAFAQDTTKVVKVLTRFTTADQVDRDEPLKLVDTSFNRTEFFHPAYRKWVMFQDLGNIGSASAPLFFNPSRTFGFQLAPHPYAVYQKRAEDVQYINTRTPYTDIFYSQGSRELLFLGVKHAQNILPRWNVGIDFQRTTSQGLLPRLETVKYNYSSHYNYSFHTSYQNKSKQYTLLANVTMNKGVLDDGGGIRSDSLFESLSGGNKVVNPRLLQAQTRYRSRAVYAKQYWTLGKQSSTINENDTVYDFRARSHFSHSILLEDLTYNFSNSGSRDTLLLPNQFYDRGSVMTDSTFYGKMENRFAFHLFNPRQQQLSDSVRYYASAGIVHSLFTVAQDVYRRSYHNLGIDGQIERMSLKPYSLSFKAYGALMLSGYNAGDLKVNGMIRYRFPRVDIEAHGMSELYTPDFVYTKFRSNAFIWDRSLDKISISGIGGKISTRSWRHNLSLEVNNYLISNWVYMDEQAAPKQDNGVFAVQTISLQKTFQAWKFYFEHQLLAQQSYSDIIRIPDFGGMTRYYFQSSLFKKLRFQIGFSVFYNTSLYANAYNPAIRMFHLQNTKRIGNYPVIDPFVNGEIKRLAFFFKYEHVNQDWFSNAFYSSPGYPLLLRSMRLGVRWRFYN